VGGNESRSDWVLGLSLVQLLFFGAVLLYATQNVEVSGQEPRQGEEAKARLDASIEKNSEMEKQLADMSLFVDEVKLMVGAKAPSKEAFQEAVDSLKRGYALCQKDDNTLVEARIQNGSETLQVIGEIPSDLIVDLAKGDETSDLEHIVSFVQDVYEYEKDHRCRFNYRLKYATDNDYKKGRDGYEKYFYPEKIVKAG
jgi:hypothetical protein